jgi:hypothetical protein
MKMIKGRRLGEMREWDQGKGDLEEAVDLIFPEDAGGCWTLRSIMISEKRRLSRKRSELDPNLSGELDNGLGRERCISS